MPGPALQPVADDLELIRILELHAEALRERVGGRRRNDLGLVSEKFLEGLEGLLLRLVLHGSDLGHPQQIPLDRAALLF